MKYSLTEIIPQTGFGAALFSFLTEKELECLKLTSKILKSDVEEYQKAKNYKPTPPPLGLTRKEGKLFLQIGKSEKKDKLFEVEKFDFNFVTDSFDLLPGMFSEFRFSNLTFLYDNEYFPMHISLTKEEHEIYTKAFETLEPKIKAEKEKINKKKALQTELRDQTCAVREVAHFNIYQKRTQFVLGLLTQDQNYETETLDESITGWNIHSYDFEMVSATDNHQGSFKVQDSKTRQVVFEKAFRSKVETNVWWWKFQTLLPIIAEERERFYSYSKSVRINPKFKGTWKPTQPWKKV